MLVGLRREGDIGDGSFWHRFYITPSDYLSYRTLLEDNSRLHQQPAIFLVNASCPWADKDHYHNCWDSETGHLCDAG